MDKYNQLMPVCKLHNAIAKFTCCGDKMICVYCKHRDHVTHKDNNIGDQTKLLHDLLDKLLSPREDGDKDRLERLKVPGSD